MIPSPTAVAKEGKSFATPYGQNPYMFASALQNPDYDFVRYEHYWNGAKLHRIQDPHVKIFENETAPANAIRTGNVNVAPTSCHLLTSTP